MAAESGRARPPAPPRPRRLAAGYAWVVVTFRWLILAAVAAGTYLAVTGLPSLGASAGGLAIAGVDEPAVRAQAESVRRFGLPLLTRTAVVQHDPNGLSVYAQSRAVLRALEVDKRTVVEGPSGDLLLALPVLNAPGSALAGSGASTTAITYLYTDPGANFGEQVRIAEEYAALIDRPDDRLVGVTGTIPVQVEQGELVQEWLPWVELGAVLAIALIIGLTFRSVLAPVITLVAAGGGYVLADRMVGYSAQLIGFSAPGQLQPVLVALVLGITTDYAIFFLSGLEGRLRDGASATRATRDAVAEYLPTVLVAGLTVAAGVLALSVAQTGIFKAFGPGLAITVLAGLVVSVTLVPALLAIFGRWVFWPRRFPSADSVGTGSAAPPPQQRSSFVVRLVARRRRAGVLAVIVIGVLLAAAFPLLGVKDAVAPASALPAGNPVRLAAEAAADGFAKGVLAPTSVIVSKPGIAGDAASLAEFQRLLESQPGVAGVLGPASVPDPLRQLESRLSELVQARLFIGPGGDTVRYLVVFDADPLGASAVDDLRALRNQVPELLARAGMAGSTVAYAGDTALGLSLADSARADIGRVALAVALVDMFLLVLFLRALVAPLYLLASSFLAVAAAMGLTTLFFQGALDQDGLVFYVPFAAGVLLVSLGSDYNIFSVGHIWDVARTRPLPDALAYAVPRTNRAIGVAGIALAASFAFVALIPVAPFQELAFAMAVGVLLDVFVVRALLVPALISLVGRTSGWPGRRLRPRRVNGHEELAHGS